MPLLVHSSALEKFKETEEFARQVGALDKFQARCDYMRDWFNGATTILFPDFAPHSFDFRVKRDGNCMIVGGLIYSGPGQPLDGSAPAFTVSLDPDSGKDHNWSIHT